MAPDVFGPVPEHFNFQHDVIERWGRERPDGIALWWADEAGHERKITFGELASQSRRAAAYFASLGIGRGDTVLMILPRVPAWWIAILGLIRLGAVPIPGTPLLTSKDIAYRLEVASIRAVITDGANVAKVDQTSAFAGVRVFVEEPGGESSDVPAGWTPFAAGLAAAPADIGYTPTRADDPGIIYFTSGTTGQAKMVVHTQASYGIGHTITGRLWLDLGPEDMIWALADTGWGKTAWSNFYGPWIAGATVFTLDMRGKFEPGTILRTLEKFPISVFCAPATALRLLVRKDLRSYRFAALRHCVSAGEALNPPVLTAWQRGTGLTIYEGYGQTETVCIVATFRSRGDEVRPGSMGKAAPGMHVAVIDEDGRELPAGQPGQIAIRVKPERPLPLFKEYWRNPEETAARFLGEWYLTGDTATRDADGYFYFVGRADDVINSSSYRIGPSEVESALQEHPAVLESAAVGVPEPMRGEVVRAYVVLRPGFEAGDKLKHELQAHCKAVTAPYKYPRQIEFVAELPKTVSGKVRRVELRARAVAEIEARQRAGSLAGRPRWWREFP